MGGRSETGKGSEVMDGGGGLEDHSDVEWGVKEEVLGISALAYSGGK